jgi:hypothetical protein
LVIQRSLINSYRDWRTGCLSVTVTRSHGSLVACARAVRARDGTRRVAPPRDGRGGVADTFVEAVTGHSAPSTNGSDTVES